MLINRETLPQHRPWIVSVAVLTLASVAGYLAYAVASGADRWPGGSSLPGLLFGVVAAVIIFFEFLLWPRKWPKVRAWRIGRTQVWLRAHIWLGLLSAPLVVLHHGLSLEWGGVLTFALMVTFWGVILSGVVGLYLQHVIPSYMLHALPGESIASQLPLLRRQMVADAQRMLTEATGMPVGEAAASAPTDRTMAGYLVVGAVRSVGRVQGRVLETMSTGESRVDRADAAKIINAFEQTIKPYLLGGAAAADLRKTTQSATFFSALRGGVSDEAREAVAFLEEICETRRQHDKQRIAHQVLHGWMVVHLPLSAALLLLLVAHVVTAIRYAGTWPI